MDAYIRESFAQRREGVTCFNCKRRVTYCDVLEDERAVCLSCSYALAIKPSVSCIYHDHSFDPTDLDLRQEMIRISEIDIQRADKKVAEVSLILPDDVRAMINNLVDVHKSSFNAEVVSAISWYCLMCANANKEAQVKSSLGLSVETELPEELKVTS